MRFSPRETLIIVEGAMKISSRDVVAIDIKRWTERKRRHMAYNSKDPNILNQLAKDRFESVRRNVAENDAAPADALLYLCKDIDRDVRYLVSKHKHTPPEALRYLANESDPYLKQRVAMNKNTPPDVLGQFFLESDGEMKKALAENPNSPEEILFKIFKQKDPSIRNRLSRNPNCPVKLLAAFTRSKSSSNRERVAEHPKSTPEILAILAKDRDNDVRGNVAHNSQTPDKVLDYLSHDRDNYVVYAVAENSNTSEKTLQRLFKENSGENGDHDIIRYMCKNERISGELLKNIFDMSRSFQNYVVDYLELHRIPQQYKSYFLKNYLERRDRKTENTEKDVHITTPEIGDGDELYEALLKRQELQYKSDALKEYYRSKPLPDYSKLPVLQFQLNAVNQTLMKYMYDVIYDWRRTRVRDRENRIVEMKQNESILSELKAARNSRDTDKQRLAIEKALNTIHSSGQMIEHYGLEKFLLDYASNMDTTKWDRQLEHMASKKVFASDGKFKYSCLMIDLPEDLGEKVISWGKENVSDDNLYSPKDAKRTYGRESHMHTTILYGIDPKVSTKDIKEAIDSIHEGKVKVKLGEISKFDTDKDFDVIKISVDGDDLHKLHNGIEKEIGAPGNEFPKYIPHITIAYVKKGSCDSILGEKPFDGQEFELDTYDFSNPDSSHEKIKALLNVPIRLGSRDI